MSYDEPGFSTLAIHAGAQPDPFGGAVGALEERLAALEGAPAALAVASGPAAQTLVLQALMKPGDEVIASAGLFNGSPAAADLAFASFGWAVKTADPDDPASFGARLSDKTRAIFIASIADGGGVADIEAMAAIARQARVPLIVDNTLATPYLLRPLDYGADVVIHSATPYLAGCAQAVGGAIVDCGTFDWLGDARYPLLSAPRPEFDDRPLTESFGNVAFAAACRALARSDREPALSPLDALLILNGVETLALRMRRHSDSALAVARHLQAHAKVAWVSYAGLEDSPSHALAKTLFRRGVGGAFAFGLKGGYRAGVDLVGKLKLFSRAANLGDARSLAIHPASAARRQLTDAQKAAAGAGPEVVRLSIGLEDVADLIADLDRALG